MLHIERRPLLAFVLSLLIHLLAISFVVKHPPFGTQDAKKTDVPLVVSFLPKQKPAEPAAPTYLPPVVADTPKPPPSQPKPVVRKPPKPAQPPVLAVPKPASPALAQTQPVTPPAAPPLQTAPPPLIPPGMDMQAYVNAARARRGANPSDAPSDYAPNADEQRDAVIAQNLQRPGTNGIFQIMSKDARRATISFRGWTSSFNSTRREMYEVESSNGDIDRAIVRKMIEIIRRYYQGDFNWQSIRLNRVVVLSARPEDNAGLEDFLLQEFFSSGGRAFN